MAMKHNLLPIRTRNVRRFRPRLAFVNKKLIQPMPGVGETGARVSNLEPFVSDGFNFPRPQDSFFDVTIRVPIITAAATTDQNVFTQEENIKAGWIRKLGYAFNSPHGYFQVRTFILVNGGVPSNYLFKTVDPTTVTYQGSFPPVQIGTIQQPGDVFIGLPSNAQVDLRFVNANTTQSYSAVVRLWGWSYAS